MIFRKKLFSAAVLIILALVPGFSVRADTNPAVPVQNNILVVQLKNSGTSIFSGDSNVISEGKVFQDAKSQAFNNVYEVATAYSLSDFKSKYGSDIVYAEPEHRIKAADVTVSSLVSPNDPGFSLDGSNIDRQWGLVKADFPEAWSLTKGSSNVTIGVLDTGIDGTHEDLSAGQVGEGFNFLTRTLIYGGTNSDDNGHGTLVSGIIAATANNFRGISGGDWNIRLIPLKALDSQGQGNSADLAAAIVWAADHGVNIINMSLGGIGFGNDTTLSNAISYAFKKNVTLISAGGNDVATDGGDLDVNPVFPVCDDNGQNMVIGVAATDVNDQKASFSNFGKACIDVSAPGKHILSTINFDPITHTPSPNAYAYGSGTSLAVPLVSAEAALIKAYYPSASNTEIRDRIIKSADPIDNLNTTSCDGKPCAGLIGQGRIDAFKALSQDLVTSPVISEGDLVQVQDSNQYYFISGSQKHPVSQFVYQQIFSNVVPKVVPLSQLDTYPTGPYALPTEGTIFKTASVPTVYEMIGGNKRPITYQIYLQRNISGQEVNVLTDAEVNSWISGTFLPPVEGTLVRSGKNQTVYWVLDGLLHPINYTFWIDRGLNIFPVMIMSDADLAGYAKGNAFIR